MPITLSVSNVCLSKGVSILLFVCLVSISKSNAVGIFSSQNVCPRINLPQDNPYVIKSFIFSKNDFCEMIWAIRSGMYSVALPAQNNCGFHSENCSSTWGGGASHKHIMNVWMDGRSKWKPNNFRSSKAGILLNSPVTK